MGRKGGRDGFLAGDAVPGKWRKSQLIEHDREQFGHFQVGLVGGQRREHAERGAVESGDEGVACGPDDVLGRSAVPDAPQSGGVEQANGGGFGGRHLSMIA